ncbi:hypothetical protein GCM10010420_56200 [Streptomyces glaucosporus]|uniref:Uncharacterized protein n=1 Tax=Streptomyces glaucosporus TaxID=284044 RepID=A0ABN3IZM8_9ACTN
MLPAEVVALADSLHTPARGGRVVDLAALRRRVTSRCRAWASCHYAAAARDLPGTLADGHRTAAASSETAVLLSRAYQLTASLLFKYGTLARTPAVLAADRAPAAAETSGDPVAIGAAARRVAHGLIHQQRYAAATDYATARERQARHQRFGRASGNLADPAAAFWSIGLVFALERRLEDNPARQRYLAIRKEMFEFIASRLRASHQG